MRLKEVERPSSGFDNLDDRDVPCALCRRRGHSSVLMIPVTLLFYLLNTFATFKIVYISDVTNKPTTRNGNLINMIL